MASSTRFVVRCRDGALHLPSLSRSYATAVQVRDNLDSWNSRHAARLVPKHAITKAPSPGEMVALTCGPHTLEEEAIRG